ncbi:MAG: TadE/TadG family type IV pilus assembly protein [Acidimicrobiia bacterium]
MPISGEGAASGRRAAARREHGAAALEFAIVGSVFFFLVFAIVDGGLAFNDYLSVGYGSKDAARQAVVGTTGSDSSCTLNGAGGAGTPTKQLLCLTKDRVGLGQADTRVKLAFGSQGYAEGADLAVCVQYQLRSRSGVLSTVFDDRMVTSEAQMRIEDLASSALQATEETPLPGGDWSWCEVS